MPQAEQHDTVCDLFTDSAHSAQSFYRLSVVAFFESFKVYIAVYDGACGTYNIFGSVARAYTGKHLRFKFGQPLCARKRIIQLIADLYFVTEALAQALDDAFYTAYVVALGYDKRASQLSCRRMRIPLPYRTHSERYSPVNVRLISA